MNLVVVFMISFLASGLALPSIEDFHSQWKDFKIAHNKKYTSTIEELERKEIFKNNLEKIEKHNKLFESKQISYSLAINKFGDMTGDEFLTFINNFPIKTSKLPKKRVHSRNIEAPPQEIDWRNQGAVGPVTNETECGYGWEDGVVGVLEAQNFLKNGEFIALSGQEILDCVNFPGIETGFEYVVENGITSIEEYPYDECNLGCRRGDKPAIVTTSSYQQVEEYDEEALKNVVGTIGPVATYVDANSEWQFYSGGIFDDPTCSSMSLNQGTLTVGYGTAADVDYWILRNTWGVNWGESGYMRLIRNNGNQCGIASWAYYSLL